MEVTAKTKLETGRYSEREERMLSAVLPASKSDYSKKRLDELATFYKRLTTARPAQNKEIWAAEEMLAGLIRFSPHAAIHMIESERPMALSLKFTTDIAIDYGSGGGVIAYAGSTLGHIAAKAHPEFQTFLFRGRYDSDDPLSAFKRKVLNVTDVSGFTVRETAMLHLRSFLREIEEEDNRIV